MSMNTLLATPNVNLTAMSRSTDQLRMPKSLERWVSVSIERIFDTNHFMLISCDYDRVYDRVWCLIKKKDFARSFDYSYCIAALDCDQLNIASVCFEFEDHNGDEPLGILCMVNSIVVVAPTNLYSFTPGGIPRGSFCLNGKDESDEIFFCFASAQMSFAVASNKRFIIFDQLSNVIRMVWFHLYFNNRNTLANSVTIDHRDDVTICFFSQESNDDNKGFLVISKGEGDHQHLLMKDVIRICIAHSVVFITKLNTSHVEIYSYESLRHLWSHNLTTQQTPFMCATQHGVYIVQSTVEFVALGIRKHHRKELFVCDSMSLECCCASATSDRIILCSKKELTLLLSKKCPVASQYVHSHQDVCELETGVTHIITPSKLKLIHGGSSVMSSRTLPLFNTYSMAFTEKPFSKEKMSFSTMVRPLTPVRNVNHFSFCKDISPIKSTNADRALLPECIAYHDLHLNVPNRRFTDSPKYPNDLSIVCLENGLLNCRTFNAFLQIMFHNVTIRNILTKYYSPSETSLVTELCLLFRQLSTADVNRFTASNFLRVVRNKYVQCDKVGPFLDTPEIQSNEKLDSRVRICIPHLIKSLHAEVLEFEDKFKVRSETTHSEFLGACGMLQQRTTSCLSCQHETKRSRVITAQRIPQVKSGELLGGQMVSTVMHELTRDERSLIFCNRCNCSRQSLLSIRNIKLGSSIFFHFDEPPSLRDLPLYLFVSPFKCSLNPMDGTVRYILSSIVLLVNADDDLDNCVALVRVSAESLQNVVQQRGDRYQSVGQNFLLDDGSAWIVFNDSHIIPVIFDDFVKDFGVFCKPLACFYTHEHFFREAPMETPKFSDFMFLKTPPSLSKFSVFGSRSVDIEQGQAQEAGSSARLLGKSISIRKVGFRKRGMKLKILPSSNNFFKSPLSLFNELTPAECPRKGDIVAFDAEFVALSLEVAFLDKSGQRKISQPFDFFPGRVTLLRGLKPSDDVFVVDDEERSGLSTWGCGDPFFDCCIAVDEPVKDHLTRYSGLRKGDLSRTSSSYHLVTLRSVIFLMKTLVDIGVIFVGHGLDQDWRTLNLLIPSDQQIDTSLLYKRKRGSSRLSLRKLTKMVFDIEIQSETHDSYVDALYALKLYLFHQNLIQKGKAVREEFLTLLYSYPNAEHVDEFLNEYDLLQVRNDIRESKNESLTIPQ
ncbi:hypothetical protein PCE1_004636 [Barthelona sp. PCE]